MKTPFFTIVTATYNRGYCITRAVESVIRQSFQDWELIIVDDGSEDNTSEVVKKYLSGKIKYYRFETNKGVNAARNFAVQKASGKFIVLLDSDNELFEDSLKTIYASIKDRPYRYYKFLCRTQRGGLMGKEFEGCLDYEDFLIEKVRGEYYDVVERDILKNTPFFEDINGGEAITWKLIAKKLGRVCYVPKTVLKYYDDLEDRLSIRGKNYDRLYKVFKKDLEVLGKEYRRVSKKYYFTLLLKIFYYKIKRLTSVRNSRV